MGPYHTAVWNLALAQGLQTIWPIEKKWNFKRHSCWLERCPNHRSTFLPILIRNIEVSEFFVSIQKHWTCGRLPESKGFTWALGPWTPVLNRGEVPYKWPPFRKWPGINRLSQGSFTPLILFVFQTPFFIWTAGKTLIPETAVSLHQGRL